MATGCGDDASNALSHNATGSDKVVILSRDKWSFLSQDKLSFYYDTYLRLRLYLLDDFSDIFNIIEETT